MGGCAKGPRDRFTSHDRIERGIRTIGSMRVGSSIGGKVPNVLNLGLDEFLGQVDMVARRVKRKAGQLQLVHLGSWKVLAKSVHDIAQEEGAWELGVLRFQKSIL